MRAFVVGTIFGSEIVCNDPAGFGQNDAVCFVEGIFQLDVLERFGIDDGSVSFGGLKIFEFTAIRTYPGVWQK